LISPYHAFQEEWGKLMSTKSFGTVQGDFIRLDEPTGLPDDSRVEITVKPLDSQHIPGTPSWTSWSSLVRSSPSVRAACGTQETSFMNAVDTDILVCGVDEDEPVKRQKARDFLRQIGQTEPPILLWQVVSSQESIRSTVKTWTMAWFMTP
jgi:hypothetical protein